MTNTGDDLPRFLQGDDTLPAPSTKMDQIAEAIRRRAKNGKDGKDAAVVEVPAPTAEVLPVGLVDKIEALEERVRDLTENAQARDDLGEAMRGLLEASKALGAMNVSNTTRLDAHDRTFDDVLPMVTELTKWVDGLPRSDAA